MSADSQEAAGEDAGREPVRRPGTAACDTCGQPVVWAACYDGRRRSFDPTPSTDTGIPEIMRWARRRDLGMVNGNAVAHLPAEFYLVHRCRQSRVGYADRMQGRVRETIENKLGPVTMPDGIPSKAGRLGAAKPFPDDLLDGYRLGYRWVGPANDAHIVRSATGRGLCGAPAPDGGTPREAERARTMHPCQACLLHYELILKQLAEQKARESTDAGPDEGPV